MSSLHEFVQTNYEEHYQDIKTQVYKKANKNPDLYEISEDLHIGSMENIDVAYIREHLQVLNHYPVMTQCKCEKTPLIEVFQKVLVRFTAQKDIDSAGWQSPVEFLQCFDLACSDIAKADHQIDEADFR